MLNGDKSMHSDISLNALTIANECDWVSRVIEKRFAIYFEQRVGVGDIDSETAPSLDEDESPYARLIRKYNLNFDERVIMMMALIPFIKPQLFDLFRMKNAALDCGYTEFGGRFSEPVSGFLPTLETALFILAADDLAKRFVLINWFSSEHAFAGQKVVLTGQLESGEPFLNAVLSPSSSLLSLVIPHRGQRPDFGPSFPARLISTELVWDDLVVPSEVKAQLEPIAAWLNNRQTILEDWGLQRHIKPGFRSLFYGQSGTGKALAATLIGSAVGARVYHVNVAAVVSSYLGETRKNLANLLDQAQTNNWILFFDEADALFGKRREVESSHQRYANLEVSYLLQRLEDYKGIVIVASDQQGDLDDALLRRFHSVIHFPMPDADERLRLWMGIIGDDCKLSDDVDLVALASKFEIAGGSIVNVVRHAALSALNSNRAEMSQSDLVLGLRRELRK